MAAAGSETNIPSSVHARRCACSNGNGLLAGARSPGASFTISAICDGCSGCKGPKLVALGTNGRSHSASLTCSSAKHFVTEGAGGLLGRAIACGCSRNQDLLLDRASELNAAVCRCSKFNHRVGAISPSGIRSMGLLG